MWPTRPDAPAGWSGGSRGLELGAEGGLGGGTADLGPWGRLGAELGHGRRRIALTEDGERLIEEVSPHFTPIYERLTDTLSVDQVKTLNDALEALLSALDRSTERAAT